MASKKIETFYAHPEQHTSEPEIKIVVFATYTPAFWGSRYDPPTDESLDIEDIVREDTGKSILDDLEPDEIETIKDQTLELIQCE